MDCNNFLSKNCLTSDNINTLKNMSVSVFSNKRKSSSLYILDTKRQKRDNLCYSAGNYPDLHQLYHKYVENLRVRDSPIPYHCPKATSIAKKLFIINKNQHYKPKCGDNCTVKKHCLDEAMKNYFHSCLKKKLKITKSDERNKAFFVKSLDNIKGTSEHYRPKCCRSNNLQECSKCLYVNIKYDI